MYVLRILEGLVDAGFVSLGRSAGAGGTGGMMELLLEGEVLGAKLEGLVRGSGSGGVPVVDISR